MLDYVKSKKVIKGSVQRSNANELPTMQSYINSFCERTEGATECVVMSLEVVMSPEGEENFNKLGQWPEAKELNVAINNTATAAIKRASSVKIIPAISTGDNNHACIIATPVISDQRTLGVIALALNTSNAKATSARLIELEQTAATLATIILANPTAGRPADANKLLQLQTKFLAQKNLADAATAFANELAVMLKFNRVSVGLMKNHQIHLTAMSSNVELQQQQNVIKLMTSAMEEAADQTESITYPLIANDRPRIHLASKSLFEKTNNATCTTPLVHKGKVIGAISLEHHSGTNINREAVVWYEHIANFIAPLIALKQDAELHWFQRSVNSLKQKWTRFITQENHTPKIVLGLAALTFLALLFIPTVYHIGAEAHIEGGTQRIISAPVEGFIKTAQVRPGDSVKKGDVLVQLADQDLLLEKEKWESEISQQENNFSGALARKDRTQYAVSQAKAAQARAELALVKQALSRSHIVASMDGIVLEGDLSQSLGAPVKQGDHLMTIAPAGDYRLMINVDERDIKNVVIGKEGSLALSALPSEKLKFSVERITPMATVKNGINTYEVQAKITGDSNHLRPGLQGIAKIEGGKKPLLLSLSSRITNWLQLTLWKWGL